MRTPTAPRTPTKPNRRAKVARPDSRTLILVAGDALSFVVFAALGRSSHGEAVGLGAIVQVVGTAIPFALGWFLVAPFLGAYRRSLTNEPLTMLKRTELAWAASWPATLILRWALAPDHNVPVSFAVVILVANAILLGGWRTAFALITGRRKG